MKTHEHRPQQLNKQPASAGTLGEKGTLPAQHTTFNTLDNWAINPPPNQKGKGPERKGYRVMARNMYTIHSVTVSFANMVLSWCPHCEHALVFITFTGRWETIYTVKRSMFWRVVKGSTNKGVN